MNFTLSFPRANKNVGCRGVIRAHNQDFFVEELLDIELAGEGEHAWLFVEKRGENTDFIARRIAAHAGVREMDIGLSGLKDRHAVTRQWFSVYLGNRAEPDWSRLNDDNLQVLRSDRHSHKLRRGQHHANRFVICVRELEGDIAGLDTALADIDQRGFPNYFGEQRFGRNGANLDKAVAMFARKMKVSKNKRGFYLSAARSFLYNRVLAERIENESWLMEPSDGPLYGELPRDHSAEHIGCSELEQAVFEQYPDLTKGLYANRLKMEARPLAVRPGKMTWQIIDNTLELAFELPTGSFATSLLTEVVDYQVFQRSEWALNNKEEQ